MTVASLALSPVSVTSIEADALVVGVIKTEGGPRIASDDPALVSLQDSLDGIGLTGVQDEVRRIPAAGFAAKSIVLAGLGSVEPGPIELRYAAGSVARQVLGIDSIAFAFETANDADVLAILEGAAIGAYAYTEHRVDSLPSTKLPASRVTVLASASDESTLISRAEITATAVNTVRDLVNAPPSHLYPETFADAAVALAEGTDVEVTVFDDEQLAAGGFGGILGVGGGSVRPPRLVKVTYEPDGAKRHVALVGKGITFDTGGLTLKPAVGMVGMKYDMAGAATALSVVLAASALNIQTRITAWLCIAENMPSGSATRPNDVLTMRGGKTVENLNSDAEGRLVMADGLVAASEENPDAIIDIATLTGAARVALGNRYVAAMGDGDLVKQIIDAGAQVGEPYWHMPLPTELRALLNSDVADIANAKPGNTAAGMLLAGVFLQEFVGITGDNSEKRKIPWAHLDIAAPANNDGTGYGFTLKGPTAVTVRTLIELAERFSLA
jgi:leucyl aminopeptidase